MKQSETKKDIMARSEHNAELARAFAASDKPKGASLTELINAYSREFDIEPAFVEKDVYVAKVLNVISGINYPDLKIVFSGGTCLSKAYNKIQRFSEDIDFRIHTDKNFTRSERKDFCDFILDKLNNIQDCKIVEISIKKGNENKFLSFEMGYKPLIFEEFIEPKIKMMVPRMHLTNLRPNIKVEFTFENLILPAKKCEIKSFLSEYIESLPATNIDCISPKEVIANKFSALMWRVNVKDRTKPIHSKENDPTIVRHLHDISAMESELSNAEFISLLEHSFESDRGRGGISENYSLIDFAKISLEKLTNDKLYRKEYTEFVDSMCYAKSDEVITFDKAIESFESVVGFIGK